MSGIGPKLGGLLEGDETMISAEGENPTFCFGSSLLIEVDGHGEPCAREGT